MKREVLLLGDPALYEVSAAVTRGELEQLRPDIEDMFECLQDAGFGHGISAPQIGHPQAPDLSGPGRRAPGHREPYPGAGGQ